ncbi:S1/P1 nuclease [Maribellus sp. YY47]|uniref:S1/P1 nuclease n=1 Tax=Maribellus sp. YY47 TaxID=2929486 RepID=UPI0020017D7A|nr:S1/P1 nuclease [Maribellus sp. YY47]MCK3682899.1 S1/P1 nuclease [Maribellus sp. YY47]
MKAQKIVNAKYHIIVVVLFVLGWQQAGAWGSTGHRAIAEIAYHQLNKSTKKKIEKILGDSYLPLYATYADDVRSERENPLARLPHYVNMGFDEKYLEAKVNERGDLVTVFDEMVARVKDTNASVEERAAALKFIIHLVGDAHQPMHVGLAEDLGGNKVDVKWFKKDTNLHYLWDEDMIDYSRLSYTELSRFAGQPTATELTTLWDASVTQWIDETHACTQMIYDNLGDKNYGYPYYYQFSPVVFKQIQKAGYRLGNVLNKIMKDI